MMRTLAVRRPNFHNDQFHIGCNFGYDISDVITKREFMNPPENDSEEEYLPFN